MNREFAEWVVAELAERFWLKVRKGKGCWLWTGHKFQKGYGAFKGPGGKLVSAHRIAYRMEIGPIPDGAMCLHRCDTPACVRPDHLWVGTNQENMRDMVAKGRANRPRGAAHPMVRLTESDIAAIRTEHAAGASYAALGKKYGCTRTNVYLIVTRRSWAHLP